MENKFESEIGLRDEVRLNIGQGQTVNAYVTAIKFYKDGDVTYDLNVQKDGGIVTVQDVHFACLTKGWAKQEHSLLPALGEICRQDTCNRRESPMGKVHWMIHDACYELSIGNLDKAKAILADADKFTHDAIDKETA
ncbi:MAG TPA: hypothetical protein VKU83_06055 [Puia sp.]|nr:hypothetical protein [Puia sp.]